MQTLKHQRIDRKKKVKKSHLLLIGSFLVFLGIGILSWNHLLKLRSEVFSEMQIAMFERIPTVLQEEVVENVPIVDNISSDNTPVVSPPPAIDYSKYLGVLEIPQISLKRGFYDLDSKYNSIQYNVTLVKGSTMPDVDRGNLILMAHSGDAYISYFAYLYQLQIGNDVYITYHGKKYHYQIVNIYDVEKTGTVKIQRNYDKTTLTLITCTKNDDTKQTIYIAELVA